MLDMDITKASLKSALGIKTDADLAREFDTTRQAIGQWEADKPIPELRQLQLRARRPELFVYLLKS